MSIVLMYHALYRATSTAEIDGEDMPYAVSESDFISQLDRITAREAGTFTVGHAPDVVITFDDGHRSNLEIAAPLLAERGLSAYFFVTSGFIDNRAGFMSPTQLRELSDVPGMIIGSHGVTHRFFADMSDSDAFEELADSRKSVENMTGKACESMSFPGGRYTSETLEMMRASGYVQWFGSDTGIVDVSQSFTQAPAGLSSSGANLSHMASKLPVRRVAIRQNTQLAEFDRMIAPDEAYYKSLRRRSQAKKLLQRTIGNRLYHGLYKSLSAR